MIHVLYNLPDDYDLIFDCLENHLMSGSDAVTIEMSLMGSSLQVGAVSMVSMGISQLTRNAWIKK